MKKNRSRILIVVGQSLVLLYFVALFFQSTILISNLSSWEDQLETILNSLMVSAALAVILSVLSLIFSCLKITHFIRRRAFVIEGNGLACGLGIFAVAVIGSYSAYFDLVMMWTSVLVAGYFLSFFGSRAFFKKRMEADKIIKSSETSEIKLNQFQKLYEQGYLTEDEMKRITEKFAPHD